ncbi:hypothetical protein C1645_395547 [Glomus cerebriforme]|uniref:Protein Lines N-terminal domain-containing protein n=1 Tax=Glomus cerebriforme TaxID=658196 RepID=A0A397THB7_9GLOM|nr:hypothetical protein C1645_395547 [Glomus cerebriforme]
MQLLEKLCDLYIDKLKGVSSSNTIESILEIFHSVLKDFRHRLSDVINENAEHNLAQHAGGRLLNILNERFEIERIINIDDGSNNLIIVSTLAVILDIKKLEADKIEDALSSHLKQAFQSILRKVDSKIELICGLLCCRHLSAVRKVLAILHYTVKSTNNIDMIFMILTGIRDYTERILSSSDIQKLIDSMLDNNHTEFFDDKAVSDVTINIECLKELINIYMEVYISLMRLYMEENENFCYRISTDIKLRILNDILTFTHGLLQQNEDSVEYIFNWYMNNDSDLASFMLNLVRLELTFREFEKKLINFDDESQEKSMNEQKSIMECISTQMTHILNYYTSHDFFLRFLISTGFNYSILLDFLISNETIFLEFLLDYCKHLEQNISQFLIICKKFDEKISEMENCAERVLVVFNNLTRSIQSLMDKNLFPYNATSLIKRLKKVELLIPY